MNPTFNLLEKHQERKKHRGILFRGLPNPVSLGFIGLVLSFGLVTCLVVANPPPLSASPRASTAVRSPLTAAKNSESGPQPQVLSAQVTLPNTAIDPPSLTQQVESILNSYLAQGRFKGDKGDKGESGLAPGFSGPNGMVNNDYGKTSSVIGGTPIVTYIPYNQSQNISGGSMAGFTQLSAQSFSSQTIAASGALTVQGATALSSNLTVSGATTLTTSTISSLTVSGDTTFTGSTTIAGLTVAGLNPGLTVGSVAFQGASGLAQDNANFYYDQTNHRLGIGTATPSAQLAIQGTSAAPTANPLVIASSTGSAFLTVASNGSTTIASLGQALPVRTTASGQLFNGAIVLGSSDVTGILSSSNGGLGTSTLGSLTVGNNLFVTGGQSVLIGTSTQITLGPNVITSVSTGTSGTVFNISTSTNSLILNLPYASAANTGQLQATDWLTFNNKLSGSGTVGYLVKYTGSTTTAVSLLYDNGTSLSINSSSPTALLTVQGSSTLPTSPIFTVSSSSNASLFTVLAGGYVGIGTTTPPYQFTVQNNSNDAYISYVGPAPSGFDSNSQHYIAQGANTFTNKYNPANGLGVGSVGLSGITQVDQATDATLSGIYGMAEATHNSGMVGTVYATGGDAYNIGTGNVNRLIGLETYVANAGGGNVNYQKGFDGYLDNWGSGIIQDARGLSWDGFGNYSTGSIQNAYAVYVDPYSDARNTWGLYIDGPTFNNYVAGKLGLGSTTPSAQLTIQGTSTAPTVPLLTVASSSGGSLFIITPSGNVGIGTSGPVSTLSVKGTAGTNPLFIASSTGAGLMVIQQNGNVGIGTTSASYLLYVGSASVASGTVARFQNVNGTCDINPTLSSLQCSSDERLKTNITAMVDDLSQVMALQPVYFSWNGEASGTPEHPGFIAQQVQQVMPEVVSSDPTTGLLSIGYSDLVPAVVGAMHQMQAEIITLQGGVFGNATTSTLTVTQAVTFEGDIAVEGNLYLSGDSVGEARILPGSTTVRVSFSRPYRYQPIVTATALGNAILQNDFRFAVSEVNDAGFAITITAPLAEEADFTWHSFESADAKLTVSDGTTEHLTVVPGSLQTDSTDAANGSTLAPTDASSAMDSATASPSPATSQDVAGGAPASTAIEAPSASAEVGAQDGSSAMPAPTPNDAPSGAENAPPAP